MRAVPYPCLSRSQDTTEVTSLANRSPSPNSARSSLLDPWLRWSNRQTVYPASCRNLAWPRLWSLPAPRLCPSTTTFSVEPGQSQACTRLRRPNGISRSVQGSPWSRGCSRWVLSRGWKARYASCAPYSGAIGSAATERARDLGEGCRTGVLDGSGIGVLREGVECPSAVRAVSSRSVPCGGAEGRVRKDDGYAEVRASAAAPCVALVAGPDRK